MGFKSVILKYNIQNNKEKKKNKALQEIRDTTKLTGLMAVLRNWDANILCMSETQTAWEHHIVREKVEKELRVVDKYAGMIGSSSSTV